MIKLELNPKHIDILMAATAQQPWSQVNETIQEVLRQANDRGLQAPPPACATYAESEIRAALDTMAVPHHADDLIRALQDARVMPRAPV
jgi:hypothetical protein